MTQIGGFRGCDWVLTFIESSKQNTVDLYKCFTKKNNCYWKIVCSNFSLIVKCFESVGAGGGVDTC